MTSVWVKICGITTEEDALLAVALGADAIGFVFAPSPRQVQPPVVADIVKRLPPEILTVGVFRDEAPRRVVELVHAAGLGGAQLHGHETPSQVKTVREHVPWVMKAFSVADRSLDHAADYGADVVLMDAPHPGSGQLFDWSLTGRVSPGIRLVLAGGLTADNVGDAIEAVQPWGVDVATGVEASPGHKDARKLHAFITAAKSAPLIEAHHPDPDDVDLPYDWRTDQ